MQALPWASLHNLYGPTEAAVDVTAWRARLSRWPGGRGVPIGAPISNVRVHVLDERLARCPSARSASCTSGACRWLAATTAGRR